MKKYDIIVAGGGFAGTAAAISAARQGQKVLLFDKSNCLGGAATNCLVQPFMPHSTNVDGATKELCAGLFGEIEERLTQMKQMTGELLHKSPDYFSEEHLKIVLNRMAVEAGVNLLFHAYLSDVICQNGQIESVIVATKAGNLELCADYYIDATGDADLAVCAGFSYHLGRDEDHLCQPMTLCFRLANVDLEQFQSFST